MMIKDIAIICSLILTLSLASISVSPVSNSIALDGSAIAPASITDLYYYEFSNGLKAFAASNRSPVIYPMKLFDSSGQVVCTAVSPIGGNDWTVLLKDTLRIYILHRTGSGEKVVRFTIQNIAGVYSTNAGSVYPFSNTHVEIDQCPGEPYIYLLSQSSTKIVSRVSTSSMSIVASSVSVGMFVSFGITLDCRSSDSLLLMTELFGYSATFDRTNMHLIKQFNWAETGKKANGGLLENLDERVSYYYGYNAADWTQTFVWSVFHDEDHPSIPYHPKFLSEFVSVVWSVRHPPLNFGTYQYLGLVDDYVAQIQFFTKFNLYPVQTLALTFRVLSFSVRGLQWSTANSALFGVISGESNNNFHSYRITLDNCYVRDSNRVCIQCKPGTVRYLLQPLGDCQPNNVPGIGLVKGMVPQSLAACLEPSCLACYADHSTCQMCDPGSNCVVPVPFVSPYSCSDLATIPDSMGCDPWSQEVKSCRSQGCEDCRLDYTKCTRCSRSMGFALVEFLCVDINTMDLGLGINQATGEPARCLSKNCQLCRDDHRYCTLCDTESGFHLILNRCTAKQSTQFFEIIKAAATPGGKGIEIVFDSIVKTSGQLLTFFELELYSKEDRLITDDEKFFSMNVRKDGFQLDLLIQENFIDGYLEIYPRSEAVLLLSTLFEPEDKALELVATFPIVIKPLSILNSPDTRKFLDSFNLTISFASQARVGLAALLVSNPFVAVMLDKLFCDLGYLRLVGAQNQTYTRIAFQMIGNLRDIPFLDLNLFKKLPKEKGCRTSKEFVENDVQCGMLGNYGSDLSYLLVILAICTGITILGVFCLKRIGRRLRSLKDIRSIGAGVCTLLLRLARFLLKSLQVRFFFLKMDAVVLDILFFSFMNIFTFNKTISLEAGLATSLLSVLFYVGYCCSLWMFAKSIRIAMASKESCNQATVSGHRELLFFQLKRMKSPLKFVRQAFEGLYYCPESPSNLIFPLVSILRYAAIALLLSAFNRDVWYIPFGCATIELVFYLYALRSAVKESRLENWLEQFNSFIHVIYNILGIISFTEFSQRSKLALDLTMLTVVAMKVLVNGILLLIAILFTLTSIANLIIKELRSRLQRKPGNSVHPHAKPKVLTESKANTIIQSTKLQINSSKLITSKPKMLKRPFPATINASLKQVQSQSQRLSVKLAVDSKPNQERRPSKHIALLSKSQKS